MYARVGPARFDYLLSWMRLVCVNVAVAVVAPGQQLFIGYCFSVVSWKAGFRPYRIRVLAWFYANLEVGAARPWHFLAKLELVSVWATVLGVLLL